MSSGSVLSDPKVSDELLRLVQSGMSVKKAVRSCKVSERTVYRYARADAEFGEALRLAIAGGHQARLRPHGTEARYDHGRCRCDKCRSAHAALHQEMRAKRKKNRPVSEFKHGAAAYTNWGCRCDICSAEAAERNLPARQKYMASPKGAVKSLNARRRRQRRNSQSLATAVHYRQQWTGPELEIAARLDLSADQVALMTGRTIYAVESQRSKIRRDPRKAFLAGEISSPYTKPLRKAIPGNPPPHRYDSHQAPERTPA